MLLHYRNADRRPCFTPVSEYPMESTDLTFIPNCPSRSTHYTDQLPEPLATFQIRTQRCLDHDNHLTYIHTSGTRHDKIHIATFNVPNEQVTITIQWRSGTVERIICRKIDSNEKIDPVTNSNGKTEFMLDVPENGDSSWRIESGDPGFHLTVKATRKG